MMQSLPTSHSPLEFRFKVPFGTIDWSTIEPSIHKGQTGIAYPFDHFNHSNRKSTLEGAFMVLHFDNYFWLTKAFLSIACGGCSIHLCLIIISAQSAPTFKSPPIAFRYFAVRSLRIDEANPMP
jgi:hypothetical protein